MLRTLTPPATRRPRRGTILVVVLALLTIFAVVGLTFVFYADNEAQIARHHRLAQGGGGDGSPYLDQARYDGVVNDTLGYLLVGVDDGQAAALLNALRGQDLMGTLHGSIPAAVTGSAPYDNANNVSPSVPFNGPGAIQEPVGLPGVVTPVRRSLLPNHTAVRFGPETVLLDPHWTGRRAVTAGTNLGPVPTLSNAAGLSRVYLPKNAGYTYPDLNNFFLASVSPTTGIVTVPSFHRPWLFNGGPTGNPNVEFRLAPWDPTVAGVAIGADKNTDWISPEGRLKTLRPRPVDQLTDADYTDAKFLPLGGRPLPGLTNYPVGSPQRLNLYKLISDRIAKGQIIDYPAPNAIDPTVPPTSPQYGKFTYTGDDQNLVGGVGYQRADSLRLDIGADPVRWNNKYIKPLVSILVTDLDGLLDLNAHGNVVAYDGTNPANPAHRSYAGYGPWEVNLLRAFDNEVDPVVRAGLVAEFNALVRARYGPAGVPVARNGRSRLPYDPSGVRLPQYALVNWNAGGTGAAFQPPNFSPPAGTANAFATSPFFGGTGAFDDNVFDAGEPADKELAHPGLYRPGDWPALAPGMSLTNPFSFPTGDLRRLRHRYAAPLDEYRRTSLYDPLRTGGTLLPPEDALIGTYERNPPATAAPRIPRQQRSVAAYRLDPAHARRLLFTTRSRAFDLPGLAANYDKVDPTMGLQLPPGSVHAVHVPGPAFANQFPAAPQPTANPPYPSDFGAPAGSPAGTPKIDGRNARAALGPVDINRPLADYRIDPALPLGPANIALPNAGNHLQARVDRQNLARDIFARLVVATGAQAHVATQTTVIGAVTLQAGDVYVDPTAAPGSPTFNALRYLAQLAVNVVDYADADDISTVFIWNPIGAAPGTNAPLAPADITTLDAATAANLPELANRIVFGAEKPRLVINEAYAEVVNDATDNLGGINKPMKDAQVRVWVELLNPTSTPYPAGPPPAGPLGAGDATLYYPVGPGVTTAFNPYQLVVTRADNGNPTVPANLADPANVAGDPAVPGGPPVTPDIVLNFDNSNPFTTVAPNNGNYNPVAGKVPGVIVVGPNVTGGRAGTEFVATPANFPTAANVYSTADTPGPNAMVYTVNSGMANQPPLAADLETGTSAAGRNGDLRRHVVLLRRLANPYLPPGPANPYLSTDTMDYVPAHDAVLRAQNEMADRAPRANHTGAGFDDYASRFAVGKVQPYAGFAQRVAATGFVPRIGAEWTATFSAVVQQAPNPAAGGEPQHTLGRQNGVNAAAPGAATFTAPATLSNTVMAPFDWLVHLDRPVANGLELLHVQAVKPHLVTQFFFQPPAAAGQAFRRGVGEAPWLGVQGVGDPQPGQPAADPTTGRRVFFTATNNQRSKNGLYRALDLLRVKPWGNGIGLGGRVAGRVNLNTVPDSRLLRALLDPQPGNTFTEAEVDALWDALINPPTPPTGPGPFVPYRTVNRAAAAEAGYDPTITNPADQRYAANQARLHTVPVPGPTVDDDPDGTFTTTPDRPFRGFGGADLNGGGPVAASNNPAGVVGVGLQDTLLRVNPVLNQPTTGVPLVLLQPSTDRVHPYQYAEAVRKLMNNATTVSNVFAVHVTVVWHEVRTDANGNPLTYDEGTFNGQPVRRHLLGREARRETPGDLRQQYFAVVDRANLLLQADPTAAGGYYSAPVGDPNGAGPRVVAQPVYTALEERAGPGTVRPLDQIVVPAVSDPNNANAPSAVSDGVLVPWANMTVVIGTGANAEVRRVTGVTAPMPGAGGGTVSVLTLSAALNLPHAAGEQVSNGLPGHPGFQKVSVIGSATSPYRAAVPYVQRVSR